MKPINNLSMLRITLKPRIVIAVLVVVSLAILVVIFASPSLLSFDSDPTHSYVPAPLTEEEKEAGVDAKIVRICPVRVYEEMRERYAAGEYDAEEFFTAIKRNCETRNYIVRCPPCDVFVQANTGAEEIILSDNLTESGTAISRGQYEGKDSYFIVQVFAGPKAGMQ